MTAEEAELTFIRCPSCRSLIPAIATRCRMCGHQFEKAGSAPAQTDDSQQRSRVRQRTASATAAEVETIKSQAAAGQKIAAPAEQFEPPSKLSSWKEFVSTDAPVADEDIDATFLNPEPAGKKRLRDDDEVEEIVAEPVEASGWEESEDEAEDEDFDAEPDSDGDGDLLSPSQSGEGLRQGGRKRRRRRKKRRSNGTLGADQFGASPAGQSFSEPAAQEPAAAPQRPLPPQPAQAAAPPAPAPQASQSPRFSAGPERNSPPPQQQRNPPAQQQGARPQAEQQARAPIEQTQVVPQQVQYQARREEVSRPSPPREVEERGMIEGMLVGWLVSFREEQNGKALEIRSGRRFIGRGHLRGSDIVYDDESVSTPHGMLVAADGDGISFQDLMSERGTYVLRSGGKVSDWSQVTHSVQLKHGDRLRFGDYEVLIVLLPR